MVTRPPVGAGPRPVRRAGRPAAGTVGGVPRNDPSDTGGLFIGRRPGTAPVRYDALPETGSARRRRVDAALAAGALALLVLMCLSMWGPQPIAWLWVGSQVDHRTGSVMAGITVAFVGMMLSLVASLAVASRLDEIWKLLRRAAGHDQRDGVLGRIFATTAIVAGAAFLVWFVILEGPSPSFAPG